jgi:hypothetical protein
MNTSELENILRQPPRPIAPAGLRERLKAQAPGFSGGASQNLALPAAGWGSWLRRWWPALAPAAATLACAAVITVQQAEIQELKSQLASTGSSGAEGSSNPADVAPTAASITASPTSASAAVQAEEIARLTALAAKLQGELSGLEAIQKENGQLASQLAAKSAATLTSEETAALREARDQASSIQCVNNLKQFGLAVRVWAIDNGDVTPPNIICMSNELSTPKILVCPADKGRQVAPDFKSFTSSNCSYEYLAPSAPDGTEPNRVLSRCALHGNIGLCDGSVQREVGKTHPEWLVNRNGKLFFETSQ